MECPESRPTLESSVTLILNTKGRAAEKLVNAKT